MALKNSGFTHIDCFSGPGGFCTGLRAAGFETKVAIEYVPSCVDTYKSNHCEVENVFLDDIRNVHVAGGKYHIPKQIIEDGVDLVTSGMPCETFSTAGNSSRAFYDHRQVLFREGIRIASAVRSKIILFENVPAITTKRLYKDDPALVIDLFKDEVKSAGYIIKDFVVKAKDFGVPQRRERYFALAVRKDLCPDISRLNEPNQDSYFNQIKETTGIKLKRNNTVRDAFKGLPNAPPNSKDDQTHYTGEESTYTELLKNDYFWRREQYANRGLTMQHPMKHRKSTIKRFDMLSPGDNLGALFDRLDSDEIARLQKERVLPKKKFIGRNIKLVDDSQSPTVTSHCLDEFVHPNYSRALTVRECARLQSFPDSYTFEGPYLVPHLTKNVQDKYEQIGDAVPPLLAYAWGLCISELLGDLDG